MRAFIYVITILIFTNGVAAGYGYRLDVDIVPDLYDITLKPYLLATPEEPAKQFTFDGTVNITLHAVFDDVRKITLHKDYIDIVQVALYDNDANLVQNFSNEVLSYDSATDKLTMPLAAALTAHANYTLHMQYKGQIRDGLSGFYRVNYTNRDGNQTWIATTQLQRIDARTVFPCFDEPALKAKFRMHISRPATHKAIFNTRLLSSEPDGKDRFLVHFEETPLMSTYLVAIIIADFVPRGDADFAILARPAYYNKTKFSYEVGRKTLKAFDAYTGLPYKTLGNAVLQNAGMPLFRHNGMENWGLAIYKEAALITEPGYTDGWANKEYTIRILVHEIAHMWFGNSVTFAWWSYFWLNEAFARYYEYFMAHELYPEYQLDQQFVIRQLHAIFATDAVYTTQPMTSLEDDIETPAQIASKFSSIAYSKGGSIVRMIRNVMGPKNFDKAIHDYLSVNHLNSTAPADLFVQLKAHWPSAQEVDLDQFFIDWTEQVGFPMLIVNISSDKQIVKLSQKRFLLHPKDGSNATLRYIIPITYTSNLITDFKNLTPVFYLKRMQDNTTLQLAQPVDWLIFNLQQANYYRVFYEETLLDGIRHALANAKHSGIHVLNRAQLLDDLFNFGRVGLLEYDVVFDFLEYLSYEVDYAPWYAAFTGLQRLTQRFTITQHEEFSAFLFEITNRVYAKLGFYNDNDSVLDVYNRNKVVYWLCKYKHDDCNAEAREIFDTTVSTGRKPSPDFRETIYCSAAREGVIFYYDHLKRWYETESLASERELLLRAMGCTRHFTLTHYMIILTPDMPREHKHIALSPMYKENPENVTPVFDMITNTIEALAEALGGWAAAANVISDISSYFTTREQHRQLIDFVAENGELFGSSITTLTAAVNNVEENLQWAEARLDTLFSYLKTRNAGATLVRGDLLLIIMVPLILMI